MRFIIVLRSDDGSERAYGPGGGAPPWTTTDRAVAVTKIKAIKAVAAQAIGADVPYEIRETPLDEGADRADG